MSERQIRIDKVDRDLVLYHWSKIVLILLAAVAIFMVVIVQFVTLSSVNSSVDQIQSCIDPHGSCYRNGDRRSSSAIQLINANQQKIVTAAAYCAKLPGNTTLAQITDCVNKELKK